MLFNTATVVLIALLGVLAGGGLVLLEQWRAKKELELFWAAVYTVAQEIAITDFDDVYTEFADEMSESAQRIQNLQREAFELKAENSKLVIQLLDDPTPGWTFVEPTDEKKKIVTTPSSNNEDDEDDDFEW